MVYLYFFILFCISIWFLGFTIINISYLKHRTLKAEMTDGPKISVLIPCRDEEANIENCVNSLANQTYKNYNIYILDDNSTDKTPEILEKLKKKYGEKLNIIKGKPLEDGWRGKAFAMHQLCQIADGEYFLFTDADVKHSETSISFAVTNITKSDSDMLSGYISQDLRSFGEIITVPLIYLLATVVLPIWMNEVTKLSIFSAAIGQYIMVKAENFKKFGEYTRVKNITTEDIYLARTMKQEGYRTSFVDCTSAARCRMYNSYSECKMGISKNVFDFLGKSSLIFIPAIIAVFVFLFMPPALVCLDLALRIITHHALISFLAMGWFLYANVMIMFFVWFILFKSQGIPAKTAFLYPLIFGNLIFIGHYSYIKSKTGTGYIWKGRQV